ncbi:GDSL esterase/lipase At5g37690-like [Silene latifolia]|uniref:GDSL esterase/lipase At5g37690-like n=1 Tax=Silene latifolia TaxID=37657 RepID=UPI003D76F667
MQLNKEAIAVTFLAMLTAFIIAIIIILSTEAFSTTITNNNDAPSPTPSSISQVVVVDDPVVRDVHSAVYQVKNNDSNSLVFSSLMKAKAMFVIGDSSVDCGENTLFYPLLRRNLSMVSCSSGSDSTLVHHFLASKMGLSEISSFYEQNGTTEGILNGLNYGSVGATILPSRVGSSFQSLNQQLRQLFETIQLLQLQLGEAEANQLVKSSVIYVSLGKEDLINFLFQNESSVPGFNNASQAFGQLLANEMTNAVRNLYNAGGRKVVVMGVLPLGCAPRAVVEWYFRNGRNSNKRIRVCVNEINQHVRDYNQRLNDRIIGLNSEVSDARFVFCDVYQGIMELISKPKTYGFEVIRGACCGRGWRGAAVGCQSTSMACTDMSKHIWWDFYNPTEAANSLLAESAWTGKSVTEMCRPHSLQVLVDTPLH